MATSTPQAGRWKPLHPSFICAGVHWADLFWISAAWSATRASMLCGRAQP